MLNVAALVGFRRYVSGRQEVTWKRTGRATSERRAVEMQEFEQAPLMTSAVPAALERDPVAQVLEGVTQRS
jgi:hypothetical protein